MTYRVVSIWALGRDKGRLVLSNHGDGVNGDQKYFVLVSFDITLL